MSIVTIEDTNLTNIADAIRSKSNTTTKYKPKEMASAIKAINTVENLSVELTQQDNLLTGQEIVIKQIIESLQAKMPENTIGTVEKIEKLLVSYFENKIVEEVEV
jgi:hypothetical protein